MGGACNSTKGSQSTQSMRHKNKINTGSQSIRKPDEKHETGSREAGGKKRKKTRRKFRRSGLGDEWMEGDLKMQRDSSF